jgi:hypothetical protein
MSSDACKSAGWVAIRIARTLREARCQLDRDPDHDPQGGDPLIIALLLVLCDAMLQDRNWERREDLFKDFAGLQWQKSALVRERIEAIMDGVNLRRDHWNVN